MSRLAVVAPAKAAELVGAAGSWPWGETVHAPLGERVPEAVAAVCLGDATAPAGLPVARLAPEPGDQGAVPVRGPWPADDGLFERGRAAGLGAGVLVIGGTPERRLAFVDGLEARGVSASERATLAPAALLAATCVLEVGDPGAPLPPLAPAVLAAGRVLVCARAEPAFGLLAGVDHLAYDDDEDALQLADAAATYPAAFRTVRAMGRIHAHAHRASAVYGRLLADLLIGVTAPPRSVEPRG